MLPVLRGCELLDSGISLPPHPSILGRAPRNIVPKNLSQCCRCYFQGLLPGKGGQLIQQEKYERQRGREREQLKRKEKGGKLLLSSMHTQTCRLSKGESNSMKSLLCHAAAWSKKSDRAGLGGEKKGEERGCCITHVSFLCLRASLGFRTLNRVKR